MTFRNEDGIEEVDVKYTCMLLYLKPQLEIIGQESGALMYFIQ